MEDKIDKIRTAQFRRMNKRKGTVICTLVIIWTKNCFSTEQFSLSFSYYKENRKGMSKLIKGSIFLEKTYNLNM